MPPPKRQRLNTKPSDPLGLGYSSSSADELAEDPIDDKSRSAPRHCILPGMSIYLSEESDESPDPLDHTVPPAQKSPRQNLDGGSKSAVNNPVIIINAPESHYSPLSEHIPTPKIKERTPLGYKQHFIIRGHRLGVSAIRFSPDGRFVASCSADATIKVWYSNTGKHFQSFVGHRAGISAIAWSPDSLTLASGSDDKSIRLWNVLDGKSYPTPLLGHNHYVYSVAFSPRGNLLASGSHDEAVIIWDIRGAKALRTLPAHSDPVGGVDFVRDGSLVASCSGDGLIRVWDTTTGQCLRTLVQSNTVGVVSVRFSPNGLYLIAWTLDSCVRLWNYMDGRCLKTYQGHRNESFGICGAFGDQDKRSFVISGSEDNSIVIWDIGSREILQRLQGHEGVVLGVEKHPSQKIIASCGLDRTVRIWKDTTNGDCDETQERSVTESMK
ncbi:MAG: WD domain protein [Trizodia sp. TS-e1964]|nr:MAG: WD domain protein [Trizodia sp. TS-e1964]